jgi:hypothetical protein
MTLQSRIFGLLALACAALSQAAYAQYAEPYQSSLRSEFGEAAQQRELLRGGVFEARVDAAMYYVNNMDLTPDSVDPVNQFGLELAPGFYAAYRSARAQGAIDYSLIGRGWEDSEYNDVAQRLAANGDYAIVPELLFIQGSASYDDAIVDQTQGANYGGFGIFDRTNITEYATASVNPYLQRRIRDFQLDVSYTYGRVWYLEDTEESSLFLYNQDSTDQSATVSFGTAEEDRLLTMNAFYEWQASEYEQSPDYSYDRAGAELGFRVVESLRLLADGGLESDLDESTVDGGLDSGYWHVGLLWTPDSRTRVEGRYGDRFFGNSWMFSLSREVRFLTFEASYSEDPTVETRNLNMGDIDPGNLPPVQGAYDAAYLNSLPFVARNAAVSVRAEGARTRISLRGYQDERDYIQVLAPDSTTTGVQFRIVRDFAANTYGEFQFRYDDVEDAVGYTGTDPGTGPVVVPSVSTYQDQEYLLRLTYEAWLNLSPSFEVGYLQRTGQADFNYDGYWVALRARYSF